MDWKLQPHIFSHSAQTTFMHTHETGSDFFEAAYPILRTLLGAFVYSLLEIVCRGYTHWTMTLTGGTAAVGLYLLHAAAPPKTLLLQCLCGALLITALEFTVGVADNLVMGWNVWDYSSMPLNLYGQICLPFSGLWFLLCIPAFGICSIAAKRFRLPA